MSELREYARERWSEIRAQRTCPRPRISENVHCLAELAISSHGSIQKPRELARFLEIVQKKQPQTVLEIGTQNGGTLFGLSQVADKNALIISIDLPDGSGGGGYDRKREQAIARRRVAGQTMRFIRADSHDTDQRFFSTHNRLQRILRGRPIDCLFIDGDHSRAGVIDDFLIYGNMVNSGGVIGIHDIVPNPYNDEIEVDLAWPDIKNLGYRTEEIIDPSKTHVLTEIECAGIGVVYK